MERRIGRCVGRAATVADCPGVQQPESAPHQVLLGFMEASLLIKSLAIDSHRVETASSNSHYLVGPPDS